MLVAAADSRGAIYNPKGIDVAELIGIKARGQTVCDYREADKVERDAVIDVPCDIWIPAARPDVVHEDNVRRLNTRLVIQGANIPFTMEAEQYLHGQGVLCVPDFIANAGGVICAAMEYRGASQSGALAVIEEKLRANTEQVLERAKREQILPREAAMDLAVERVKRAMQLRRWALH